MKILKRNDWTHECTCGKCTSVLEIHSEDLRTDLCDNFWAYCGVCAARIEINSETISNSASEPARNKARFEMDYC